LDIPCVECPDCGSIGGRFGFPRPRSFERHQATLMVRQLSEVGKQESH
jgi:hypothetical protein